MKQFATPETKDSKIPKVWAFSKKQHDPEEPVLISITDPASNRFMYSALDDEGNCDLSAEKKPADLEQIVSKIWADICHDFLDFSGSVRKIISLFLATIMPRGQKSFNLTKKTHNNLRSFFDSLPKDDLGIPPINKFIHKGKMHDIDLPDWQGIECDSDNYIRQMLADITNEDAIHSAKILLDKNWSVRTFSQPILATSDAPFIMCNTTKETCDIGTKGTIAFFPLTPYRALEIGGNGEDNMCYPMSDKYAHLINYLLWTNDCRFIYSHRNTDEVLLEIHNFVATQKAFEENGGK